MTTTTLSKSSGPSGLLSAIWRVLKRIPPVYPVFLVIFIAVGYLNPTYQTADGIYAFLRRAAPLAILTIGEMMVLAAGGFDLSVGSIITLVIIGSSMTLRNDPDMMWPSILMMFGLGALIGLANGIIVSFLRVPSLIATLGMLLLVRGVALYWSGGAPKGYFTDNWRFFGRGWIENIPAIGSVPASLIILLVVGLLTYYIFHRANFGKQILAIGDNMRAAELSGVRLHPMRILVFVFSAVLAVTTGILLGGYGGIGINVGDGYEMRAVSAAVIGGTLLLGGKGSVPEAIFGAFTLEALFALLNLLGLPKPYRDAVQGLIIIGAVAYVSLRTRRTR
jgi:ribose transport system permease protein